MLNSHVFFNTYNTSANVTLPLLNTVFGGVVSEREGERERDGEVMWIEEKAPTEVEFNIRVSEVVTNELHQHLHCSEVHMREREKNELLETHGFLEV